MARFLNCVKRRLGLKPAVSDFARMSLVRQKQLLAIYREISLQLADRLASSDDLVEGIAFSRGKLLPGLTWTTWPVFEATFGGNAGRDRLMSGLKLALEDLRRYQCSRVFIGGSFVSQKTKPRDFDLVFDGAGMDLSTIRSRMPELIGFSEEERCLQLERYGGQLIPNSSIWLGVSMLEFLLYDDRYEEHKGVIGIRL